MHVNGESSKGFLLSLLAEGIGLITGKRCFLTFHGGGRDQRFFGRPRYPCLIPMYWLLFGIPRRIICNSDAVKAKIVEYGVPAAKITPIPAFSVQYVERSETPLPPHLEAFLARVPAVIFTYVRIRTGFYLDTLIEGFAQVAVAAPQAGLVVCGLVGDVDPALHADFRTRIERHRLADRICLVDDLTHEQFLQALSRSALYLRTPTTDGVASSVLESLALGVPVVGSENGARPPGVICYPATDDSAMAAAVLRVLESRDSIVASMPRPPLRDTVAEEVALLTRD
jgi:glycosyltransferase involved in cell wall biosynthesis